MADAKIISTLAETTQLRTIYLWLICNFEEGESANQ